MIAWPTAEDDPDAPLATASPVFFPVSSAARWSTFGSTVTALVCFSTVSRVFLPAASDARSSTFGSIVTLTTLPSTCFSIASVTP